MLFEYYYAAGLGHFRLSAATGPIAADRKVLPPEVDDFLTIPRDRRTAAQQASLNRYFASIVPELKAARKEIAAFRHTEPVLPTSLVLSERPPDNPRATYVHKRGDFLRPTERVEAGVPSLFGPVSRTGPRPVEFRPLARQPPESTHRPGYAEPAVASVFRHRPGENDRGLRLSGHPAHAPRAARLACGRTIERELVAQGDAPLDCDKRTYRQSSQAAPQDQLKDPENKLLSHAPRVRLEAELVRDGGLKAAGLLSEAIGGPSVFPRSRRASRPKEPMGASRGTTAWGLTGTAAAFTHL